MPSMPEDVHYAIDHLLLANVTEQWGAVRNETPWFCHEEKLKRVKKKLNHKHIMLPLDKSVCRLVVVCKKLYYNKLIIAYNDPKQFTPLYTSSAVEEAHACANQQLYPRYLHEK